MRTLEGLLGLDLELVDVLTPCGQLFLGLSEGGLEAIAIWQTSDDAYPFETEEYDTFLYGEGQDAQVTSRRFFDDAQKANKNGDRYELASTFLTIVLFFAGISFVLSSMRIRKIFVGGSAVILVASAAYLLLLPKTF